MWDQEGPHCQGDQLRGRVNSEVKCCTPGVTVAMVSFHWATPLAACLALQDGVLKELYEPGAENDDVVRECPNV